MVSEPSELNETSDDDLRSFAIEVLNHLRGPMNGQQANPLPAPRARFVTADILSRFHNVVVEIRRSHNDYGGWSKQAAVAKVVATFTGIALRQVDAEYIGNAQDTFLRDYGKAMEKAKGAERKARKRAVQSGREVREEVVGARVLELKQQVFRCKFGGVPRNYMVMSSPRGEGQSLPIHRQAVPVRRVEHADEVNLQLKERMIQLQEESAVQERDMNLNLQALCHAIDREQRAREAAERHAEQIERAQEEALAKAASEVQRMKRRIQDAERDTNNANGQVYRLQSQLGAAHVDVARAADREQKVRSDAEAAIRHADSLQAEAASKANEKVQQLKRRIQEAERETSKANAQVYRLQSQLGAAHVDAARAAEREQGTRSEAEDAARHAACARAEAVAKVTERLHQLKKETRQAVRETRDTKASMQRLGSQLGRALVEAARAAECAREATQSVDQLKERLKQQEEDAAERMQHLRDLKANMAKRARDSDRRASHADRYLSEVTSLREKLRTLRKETNATRVQLNLEVEREGDSDEDNDMMMMEEAIIDDTLSDGNEDAEAAMWLQRIKAMPTWRAVRGKGAGRGEKKLEWGTRLTIYALLAMMIPASAVGMAIVAIVKRTAPWLQPTAPTYETVKRCRFELRFIEEAIAARRVAAAHRLRSIGFDETTKLGRGSLTSNLQIEATAGAPLEDVILRAAYCPMGGTSELIAKSIETKCFSRLRDFLRRWKAMHESMFPDGAWTGPDPAACSMHRLAGGGAIISDTCNTARKARSLLAEEIARQCAAHVGQDAWQAMDEAEQQAAVRTYHIDCWQHMRNIFLEAMSAAMAQHVQQELQPELDTFSAWERMSTDFSQLLRASFKEFHHSCRYYKGQGRSYTAWLQDTHPTSFAVHLERADGGRQELASSV